MTPEIPGLEVAAAYRPAGRGDEVGGDFYDVFQIAEGDWVVVLGDVCGKGVEAAVVTSLVRHTVRALAVDRAISARRPAPAEHDPAVRATPTGSARSSCSVYVRAQDGWKVTTSSRRPPLPLHRGPAADPRRSASPG